MRRFLPISVLVALAALAAVALAQVDGAPAARLATTAASGSFEVANSADGEPIFTAANIGPGGSAEGMVTIENTGSAPAALLLRRGEVVDSPGLGGGTLSDRLRLDIVDLTAPASPRTVYSGPLATMPDQPAGELAPGEAHTFRFTVSFPDAGTSALQNSVQGASTTVAYAWIAAEPTKRGDGGGSGGEGGPPGGGPSAGRTGGGASSGGSTSQGPTGNPTHLALTVPKVLHALRGGRLLAWTDCNEACRVSVSGRLRAAAAGHHRGTSVHFTVKRLQSPGRHGLRILVPRWLRAWLRHEPPPRRLRATLRFAGTGIDGTHAVVRRQVRLWMSRH